MDLDRQPEPIRWSASDFDSVPEVVETQLLLPTRLFIALEREARRHNMTAGQMARVLIARAVLPPDSPDAPTESCWTGG